MLRIQTLSLALIVLLLSITSQAALAAGVDKATLAVSGYDLVSYHSEQGPQPGNGYFVSEYDGATYLFANKQNKARFDSNPEKYLPVYGGYCAYGVSVGKKFYSDPLAWKIVDGKLYLNLDADIQKKWLKDIPGHIKSADANWMKIKDKAPSEL